MHVLIRRDKDNNVESMMQGMCMRWMATVVMHEASNYAKQITHTHTHTNTHTHKNNNKIFMFTLSQIKRICRSIGGSYIYMQNNWTLVY